MKRRIKRDHTRDSDDPGPAYKVSKETLRQLAVEPRSLPQKSPGAHSIPNASYDETFPERKKTRHQPTLTATRAKKIKARPETLH